MSKLAATDALEVLAEGVAVLRGEAYFSAGAVAYQRTLSNKVVAEVDGTEPCWVELRKEDGKFAAIHAFGERRETGFAKPIRNRLTHTV